MSGLPSDGYGRGSTISRSAQRAYALLSRGDREHLRRRLPRQVIDVAAEQTSPDVKQWSSTEPDTAIADFVGTVMGLVPGDPRVRRKATAILKAHFTAATQQGATPADALKSTFVAACLSPSAISIGL